MDARGETKPLLLMVIKSPMSVPQLEVFQLLLESRSDVNVQAADGSSALAVAVAAAVNSPNWEKDDQVSSSGGPYAGRYAVIECLLAKHADPNTHSHQHRMTPLMIAAMGRKLELCKMMLAACADVEATSSSNLAACDYAGHMCGELDDMLARQGADMPQQRDALLQRSWMRTLAALGNGHLDLVSDHLAAHTDVASLLAHKDSSGNTILHLVSMGQLPTNLPAVNSTKQRTDAVELLLRHRAAIDSKNMIDETPLTVAVKAVGGLKGASDCSVIRALLQNSANVDNVDKCFGETPLMEAACAGAAEVVHCLLQHRADPLFVSNEGFSALSHATAEGHKEVVRLLEQALMDEDEEDGAAQTSTPSSSSVSFYHAAPTMSTPDTPAASAPDALLDVRINVSVKVDPSESSRSLLSAALLGLMEHVSTDGCVDLEAFDISRGSVAGSAQHPWLSATLLRPYTDQLGVATSSQKAADECENCGKQARGEDGASCADDLAGSPGCVASVQPSQDAHDAATPLQRTTPDVEHQVNMDGGVASSFSGIAASQPEPADAAGSRSQPLCTDADSPRRSASDALGSSTRESNAKSGPAPTDSCDVSSSSFCRGSLDADDIAANESGAASWKGDPTPVSSCSAGESRATSHQAETRGAAATAMPRPIGIGLTARPLLNLGKFGAQPSAKFPAMPKINPRVPPKAMFKPMPQGRGFAGLGFAQAAYPGLPKNLPGPNRKVGGVPFFGVGMGRGHGGFGGKAAPPPPPGRLNQTNYRHYAALGLQHGASAEDVRRAYHRLALQCHPDKNNSPDAAEHFRKVKEAYEALQ
mmetsp:Transcript_36964/g.85261  ORF Transcript_36964/g.85261 Transcript_36964/m.85261 type:complete len:817 (-) Transcript_36964:48-2498(-)